MKRKTLQNIVRFLIRHLTKTEFIDIENMPSDGGVIIAINHMSHIDTPVLFANPHRPDITALVTTKYQASSLIRWFTSTTGWPSLLFSCGCTVIKSMRTRLPVTWTALMPSAKISLFIISLLIRNI